MSYFESVGFQRDFARFVGAMDKLNGNIKKMANPPEMVMLESEVERPTGPCCECAYWDDFEDKTGACHRHAPRVPDMQWPRTKEFGWCGEWLRDVR